MEDYGTVQALVVEDNLDNMFLTEELLRHSVGIGYVAGLASGRELFSLLETQPDLSPQLILLDIQIPLEDGYTILKQIRKHPRLTQTKVVALTANVMNEDIKRAQYAGFDSFIGKPLNYKRFPQQITMILSGERIWAPH